MGFSRQEYWSGLPCPPPGLLSDPGIKPMSSASPAMKANSLLLSHQGSHTWIQILALSFTSTGITDKSLKCSELVLSSTKQRYYNLFHRSSRGVNGLICLSHLAQAWSVCVCVYVCIRQSCLTLCNPMGCSPPHSSSHGILQARILEWVAIPFSRAQAWYITHNYIHSLLPVPHTPSVHSLLTLQTSFSISLDITLPSKTTSTF